MTIASLIPIDLKNFLKEIEGLGFSLCLVGGAPRDYLMNKVLSHDLDFEVRNLDINVLKTYLKNKKIPYTVLPYDIIRVTHDNFDLEFSTPRKEYQIAGNKTHHHFEAVLDPKLSYAESFKRRDFTINAIGLEMNFEKDAEVIIDPYKGVKDLEKGVLKQVGADFFLDSVRFLRMIRFSQKYHLSIADSITKNIKSFDLTELSVHHFIEEMMKSKAPGNFINSFNEFVVKGGLKIPDNFKFWSSLNFPDEIKTRDDILVFAFLQEASLGELVSVFFSMPSRKIKDLKSFIDSHEALSSASVESLREIIARPLKDISEAGLLKDIKNLEEKKEWKGYFTTTYAVSWEGWESQKSDVSELELLPNQMKSYVKFYKALQRNLKR